MSNNASAFPHSHYSGMSIRDYFAGQALANPSICTGTANNWELVAWFGNQRTGITRAEIIARQALVAADAMIATLAKAGPA